MVCNLDGSFVPASRAELAEWKVPLEPVFKHGRLFCHRETSPLFDWGHVPVSFDAQYPCGLRVTATQPDTPFSWVDMHKLRQLAELNSPIVLRGFVGAGDRGMFVAKAGEMGAIQRWKFGELLAVKDAGAKDGGLNNVLSAEPMPFHFDGLFKVVDGKPQPPR